MQIDLTGKKAIVTGSSKEGLNNSPKSAIIRPSQNL